jgi:hypothetical protein
MELDELLLALTTGPRYRFADWPNPEVPAVAAGVYTVWDEDGTYLYVGMSGRGLTEQHLAAKDGSRATGLRTRLASHASGRRSGDQFCVYVADRLVLPILTPSDIEGIAAGTQSFDALVRGYIKSHLGYRFVIVPSGRAALDLEHVAAARGLDGSLPLLNPR